MMAQHFKTPDINVDPTADMSAVDKLRAGIGRGMTSAARGVGQLFGLVNDADIAEAKKTDAALMNTTAGKVGNVVGLAGVAAPTALIPGANTALGATLIGGGIGGLTTEGDAMERLKGAGAGAAGGLVGKYVGDALGTGARYVADKARTTFAATQAANAQKQAAAEAASKAGYVIPPADLQPGAITEALSGLSGKIKTAQVASQRNQEVTNALARKALGIADDAPLSTAALDSIRADAGQAYGNVAKLGTMDATGATLPKSVATSESLSPLMMGKTQNVEAAELVRAWKQSNHDATAYYRAYARDANPETLAKAKANAGAAKQIDEFLQDALTKVGKGDLRDKLLEARRTIAKSYTVEKALNPTTGDVSAQALAKELAKGKPLSGDLLTAAEAGLAFPKATQALKEAPKAMSPLDFAVGGLTGASTGNPLMMAAVAARPAVRSLLLSPMYQRAALSQASGPGLLSQMPAGLLDQAITRRMLPGLLSAPLASVTSE